ncbi:MAG: DUF4358 domain-containing protein [Lachnospiraceae bacterium]|nr:DUF4358 domain-containing protein [Lachnospiraceae bacterium]
MRHLFAAGLLAALLLCACTGKNTNTYDANPAQIAAELADGLSYDTELVEIPQEDIGLYLDIPDGTEGSFYKSNSTTESIAVFKCADSDIGAAVEKALLTYLDEQRATFEAYDPEEISRLGNACLERKGNIVILCIARDRNEVTQKLDELLP